jgi:hypothetical protein
MITQGEIDVKVLFGATARAIISAVPKKCGNR